MWYFSLSILLISNLPSCASDMQLWTTYCISGNINKAQISLSESFRLYRNLAQFSWMHTDFGIDYRFLDWLDVGVHYWHIYKKGGASWENEISPYLQGSLSADILKFELADNNRLEFQKVPRKDLSMRYRNKLACALKISPIVKPYIADELFFSQNDGFSQNRFYSGFKYKAGFTGTFDLHYILRNDRIKSSSESYHIFGIIYKNQFRVNYRG